MQVQKAFMLCEVLEPDAQEDPQASLLIPRVSGAGNTQTFDTEDKAIAFASAARILGSCGGRVVVVELVPIASVEFSRPAVTKLSLEREASRATVWISEPVRFREPVAVKDDIDRDTRVAVLMSPLRGRCRVVLELADGLRSADVSIRWGNQSIARVACALLAPVASPLWIAHIAPGQQLTVSLHIAGISEVNPSAFVGEASLIVESSEVDGS